jgi:serine/threonine protein kinase
LQIEDRFYIYLEYVHPGSINKYVKQHYGAMTESVVRNFTRHILRGLAFLHGQKIMHRCANLKRCPHAILFCQVNCHLNSLLASCCCFLLVSIQQTFLRSDFPTGYILIEISPHKSSHSNCLFSSCCYVQSDTG